VIPDDRFKIIEFDPRFKKISSKKMKIGVESRFSAMLNDKRFKIVSKYDKYGRKAKAGAIQSDLKDIYQPFDEKD
jgi:hypothetical protein